jgi:CP family cyanate transporter-like MFS transporter
VALPILGIALLAMVLATQTNAADAESARWPNWRDGLIWRLGVMFGSINAVYFASNAFLPSYLTSLGRRDLIDGALVALNLGQLPASLAMPAIAGKLELRAWPHIAAGVIMMVSVIGIWPTV